MKSLEDLERAFDRGLSDWENKIVVKHARVIGKKVEREIKRLTPVQSGNLRRRWFSEVSRKTNDVAITISNDADYAPHVNYGHRVVRGGKTVGHVEGQHMLEKGMQIYQDTYLKADIDAMLEDLKGALK